MSPILPHQTLVRPTQLAALLGVSRSTLHRWMQEDVRIQACVFRPGFLSVQKLRDAGILTRATSQLVESAQAQAVKS